MRTGCWWGNPKERGRLEGLGLIGGIILKWSMRNRMRGRGLD